MALVFAWVLALSLVISLFTHPGLRDPVATRLASNPQLAGIAHARALMPVLHAWQHERLAAVSLLTGAAGVARGDVTASQQAWAALQTVQRVHGQALGSDGHWRALQQATRALPGPGSHPAAVFEAHGARVQALIDLLAASAEGSNLTLDSHLGSYHLMDAAFFQLPALIETVAQLRILAAAAPNVEPLASPQLRPLVEQVLLASRHLAALDDKLRRATLAHPELDTALGAPEALLEVRRLLESVEALALRQPGRDAAQARPELHAASADRAIEDLRGLTVRAQGQLERLIELRSDRLQARQRLLACALLLGLGLLVRLLPALHRVAGGRRGTSVSALAAPGVAA